jgi:CheY-like chemotaxis protein/DNA-directed RNA polymerase specialized sigma24 family protein
MHPTAQQISGILPDLRRYARALSGSRALGDGWIAACLESLLSNPARLRPGDDVKFEMLRRLHRCAKRATGGAPGQAAENEPRDRLEREMLDLPLVDRQILLLVALEGFSLDRAALLTGLRRCDAARRLDAVRRRLSARVPARVLIIEDEPIVAMDLVTVVRNAGHVSTGVAPTNRRALELARDRAPDLILADVRLRSGESGIAAIKEILRAGALPVIFVTGYPERVLTREGIEPSLLVPKPFDPEFLGRAINQAVSGGLPAARERVGVAPDASR